MKVCFILSRGVSVRARQRDAFSRLGASLVFLIDWNKARKVLREWFSKRCRPRSRLGGATSFGHRGFLELAGANSSLGGRHATPARIGFGERLDQRLGAMQLSIFLRPFCAFRPKPCCEGGSVGWREIASRRTRPASATC